MNWYNIQGREAVYARNAAALCGDICQACGTECMSYPDDMSQHCGMICLDCARHCRSYAIMGMPHRRRQRETDY